jgi:hypothetical protein
MVGFLLDYLAIPLGVLSIVLMMATLLFALWLLEEFDTARERRTGTASDVLDGLPA